MNRTRFSRVRAALLIAATLVVLSGVGSLASFAQTATWTNASVDSWKTGSNWSGGEPTASLTALIGNGGTATLSSGQTGNAFRLLLGGASAGSLEIDGGVLNTSSTSLVGTSGKAGTLSLSNSALWTSAIDLVVGDTGAGTLNVSSGSDVTGSFAVIGNTSTGSGTVTVAGSGSTVNLTAGMVVGKAGQGTMNVTTGGKVANAEALIGRDAGSSGTVLVSGLGSSWTNSGNVEVGGLGSGVFTLDTNAVVSVGSGIGTVMLGASPGSSGILNFGGAVGESAQSSGFLQAGTVTGGLGSALVNFNHSSIATFAQNLTGSLSVQHNGFGYTTLTGTNSYTGTTTISNGRLIFGQRLSLYNGVTSNWTASNLVVSAGAFAGFNVGGAGEFTAADLVVLGSNTGGFASGSTLGLITTNAAGGVFAYGGVLADGGTTAPLTLLKLGTGTLSLSGTQAYSGTTLVKEGTLGLNGSRTSASISGTAAANTNGQNAIATVRVESGASLQVGASGQVKAGKGGGGGQGSNGITEDLSPFPPIPATPGQAGGAGGAGGNAVEFATGGSLTIAGTLTGGSGGNGATGGKGGDSYLYSSPQRGGDGGRGGSGGAGLVITDGSALTIGGSITGGAGGNGGNGGQAGADRNNFNTITSGGRGGNGGDGGAGINYAGTGTLTVTGTIRGGAAGPGGSGGLANPTFGANGTYGTGGSGVSILGGGALDNQGSIAGGSSGGAGVTIGGGSSVLNRGTITAGAGADYGVRFSGAGSFANSEGGTVAGGIYSTDSAASVTLNPGSVVQGNVQLGSASTLTLTGTGATNYSSAVTGTTAVSGALLKNGPGAWIVDKTGGNFTLSGTLTIAEGMLQLNSRASLFGGTQSNWTNATIKVSSGASAAFAVGGTDGFTSSDIAVLKGLTGGAGGFSTGALLGIDTSNATGGSFDLAASLANSPGIRKLGSGTLILSGDNTGHTGRVLVEAGALQFAARTAFSGGSTANWTADQLAIESGASAIFNIGGANEFTSADIQLLAALGSAAGGFASGSTIGLDTTHAVGGSVTNTTAIGNPNGGANILNLTKLGTGTLVLSGSNSFTGVTTVESGTLQWTNAGTIRGGNIASWTDSTLVVKSGATGIFKTGGAGEFTSTGLNALGLDKSFQAGSTLIIDVNSAQTSDVQLNGFSNSGVTFVKEGAGRLILAQDYLTNALTIANGSVSLTGNILARDGASGVSGSAASLNVQVKNSGQMNVEAAGGVVGGTGGNGASYVFESLYGGPGGAGGPAITATESAAIAVSGQVRGGTGGGGGGGGQTGFNGNSGSPGGAGGYGVVLNTAATLLNSGEVIGGAGGVGGHGMSAAKTNSFGGWGAAGGSGNAAVKVNAGSLTNSGSLLGGTGGDGGWSGAGYQSTIGGTGGTGGAAVIFSGDGTFTNTGSVSGGTGGRGGSTGTGYFVYQNIYASGGDGGDGVVLTSGTLRNFGTISGGAGGSSLNGVQSSPGVGLKVLGSATVYNEASGVINQSMYATGSVTFHNSGTVNGDASLGGSGDTVRLFSGSRITGALNIGTEANSTLTLDGTGATTFSTAVGGQTTFAGSLAKEGTGTWTLDGGALSGVTGTTTISAGTLQFGGRSSLYNGATANWTAANLRVANGAAAVFGVGGATGFTEADLNQLKTLGTATGGFQPGAFLGVDTTHADGGSFTWTGDIANPNGGTNALGLIKTGAGELVLAGNNTYTGSTSILEGSVRLSGALGASPVNVSGSGAALDLNGGNANLGSLATVAGSAVFLSGGTLTLGADNSSMTIAGTISDTGGFGTSNGGKLIKSGTGTLTLAGSNHFSGGTTVTAGKIDFNGNASFGTSGSTVTLNGGTMHNLTSIFDFPQQIALGAGGGTLVLGSGGLTLLTPITGPGALTKTSGNILTLTGAQTYLGATSVQGGILKIEAGSLASSGVEVASAATLLFNNGGSYAGPITGAGALSRSGTGTTVLTGAASHTGGTTVDSGTLQVGSGGNLGSLAGNVTVGPGAVLAFNRSDALAFGGAISGGGGITQFGTGTTTLSGNNTYAGRTTINTGTLQINSAANLGNGSATNTIALGGGTLRSTDGTYSLGTSRDIALTAASAIQSDMGTFTVNGRIANGGNLLTLGGAGNIAVSGIIDGAGGLTKAGAGTLTLSGANTFAGDLTVSSGTVSIGAGSALGTGTLVLDAGTLHTTADMVLTKNITLGAGGGAFAIGNGYFTASGNVTGSGGLTKTGASILTLQGAHTYTGATIVNGGALKFAANGGTPSTVATSSIALGSGAKVVFDSSQTYAGSITGAGVLERGFTGTTILTGAASHAGGTNIIGGTVQVGSGGASGSLTGNVVLSSGGTLSFNRSDSYTFTGAVSGSGTVVQAGAGTLVAGSAAAFGSVPLRITHGQLDLGGYAASNALTVQGGAVTGAGNYSGTATIAGAASFSGAVGGTHVVASSGALNTTGATFSGSVTVQSGGLLSGTGRLGALAVQSGGVLAPGNSPGLLTIAGDLSLAGTTRIQLEGLARGTSYDAIDVSGVMTFGGALEVTLSDGFTPSAGNSFDVLNYNVATASGSFAALALPALAGGLAWDTSALYATGTISVSGSAIPEPSTYAALAGCVALVLAAARRPRGAARRRADGAG